MDGFRVGAQDQAEQVAERLRANVSGGVLQTRTGALLESILLQPMQQDGLNASIEVQAGDEEAWYGAVFETGGSGAYEITAKGKALAFVAGGGDMIFRKLVSHPPIPELPWFAPVIDEMSPGIVEGIADAIKSEVEG